MELHFLGRGAAFYPEEGNTSACIREDDHLFLIDCGETVFGRLKAKGFLDGVKRVTVLLSHLHADHSGSLGTLALYARFALQASVTILVPPCEAYVQQIETLLSLNGLAKGVYAMKTDEAFEGMCAFSAVRYVKTEHAPGMNCFSFVFDTPQGAVFYSADAKTAQGLRDFIRTHERIAAIYVDASSAAGGVHMTLQELDATIPAALRSRVRLMHVNCAQCIELGKAMGFDTVRMG